MRATRLFTVPYLSEKSSRCAAFLGPLPKRRFHSHPQAKPGTFDTKMATCYVLDPNDLRKNRTLNSQATGS